MLGANSDLKNQDQGSSRINSRLERVRDQAGEVLARLDSGAGLSALLPQAKAVVDEDGGSPEQSFWLELEIFGLAGGPFTGPPFTEPAQKAGGLLYTRLHSARISTEPARDELEFLKKDKVFHESINEIERQLEEWGATREVVSQEYLNQDQLKALSYGVELNKQRERVLSDVRSQVYEFVARLRRNANRELENMALLGPDYRVVLDSLDALSTDFRQELVAALEYLSSPNPAAWSGAGLLCRNVVLALGKTLFTVEAENYESALDGKTLNLKGQKELNRLLAFIDYHWRKAPQENQPLLKGMGTLAVGIYHRGSAGKEKGKVRRGQAQQLVVDAFELVAGLNKLVGLEPVVSL